ncbi:DsbC family protein [Rhizobacter sp. Root404]|jgi:thiol:disulfide interchange protein DsbC|uniref:DsbC family protein n=1 Tax=Rhizobacter sp. Root404 TaxID=1736528 RepID=UPI000701B16D|nr:DsbC family protein [Rhizobacter sp. Root404]KQW38276.1 disulfide isomerase [Rhizobacter sp. Root404]
MNILMRSALALTVMSLGLAQAAFADEALIRKTLAERLPNFPAIDEVSKTPIPGLYEVRIGTELIYTDERGDHVIQGSIIETKTRSDLTQARIDKITAIDFAALPLKDAIVWKQGTGARKLVVFADPNCGYCKKFETEMQQVKDVTVYTFLYPILGGDSPEKSKNIWCAKDNGAAWRDWMIKGTAAPRSMGNCDTAALQRNVALGKKFRVNGTPALVFEDGKRVPGALPPAEVEKQLVASRGKG